MNPVVHFEMPYTDRKRLAKFYKDTFGWGMEYLGKDMMDYVLANTSGKDKNNRPTKPGNINGGFFPRKPDWPAQYPSVVIAVKNISAAMKKIKKSGGKVLGKPMVIPGNGKYVSFIDTEGNRVSIIEPSPMK